METQAAHAPEPDGSPDEAREGAGTARRLGHYFRQSLAMIVAMLIYYVVVLQTSPTGVVPGK